MRKTLFYIVMLLTLSSCIKQINLFEDLKDKIPEESAIDLSIYHYPYSDENSDIIAKVLVKTKNKITNIANISAHIPTLKYNKTWLLLLSQDDCKQSAFCRTWAVINGKPYSSSVSYPCPDNSNPDKEAVLFYDYAQLSNNDLPPNVIKDNKTLGSTDGLGNEVRFTFTTTVQAEEDWMDKSYSVRPGYTANYHRFFMHRGLDWLSTNEILNFGNSMAFHDLSAIDLENKSDLLKHFEIAQNIIQKKLNGRICKVLTEPNGNKNYIEAAFDVPEIVSITSQGNYSETLFPYLINDNIDKKVWTRTFNDSPEYFKQLINDNLHIDIEARKAICIGVHEVDNSWSDFFHWINDTYGKDGDDSVWFTSQEEYHEYIGYVNSNKIIDLQLIDDYTIQLNISLSSKGNGYYPSITLNLDGVNYQDIDYIETSKSITGFSYGNYSNGTTMNIDCRKHLMEKATYYVSRYDKNRNNSLYRQDAIYFTNQLKAGDAKNELKNIIYK